MGLFAITFAGAIICIIFWVPAGTDKKRNTDLKIRKKQKIKTLWVVAIWAIVVGCLGLLGQYPYIRAVIYGAVGALFLISPIGYGLLASLDNTLNKFLERR